MEPMLARVVDEAHARQLPVLIAEWLAAPDVRQWIARALRIDLAVLDARPELVVPCLLRRCARLGREGGHYKLRPPPPADAGAVRALADRWRADYTLPYLAALRPPPVPLDGAVIEEYRTSLPGVLYADHDTIGIAGEAGAIAWQRASGRRIASTFEPPAKRWQFERGARGPIGPAGLADLGMDPDESAWDVIELDGERALVSSRIDDPYGQGDDTHYLRLVEGTRVVWRGDGYASGGCVLGDRVITREFKSELVARDLATGKELARYHLGIYPRDLVAIDRTTFVTRDVAVIRVWDATRTPWPGLDLASVGGGAVWSPDGKRVNTGYAISDAHTGALLCTLDLHGIGNWMEGGPPADCRRLCNDVFVEHTPFGLYAWDTTTGQVVVEDRRRTAEILDAVAFDPTGRYHASWPGRHNRNGPNPLRVYALHTGEVLFERSVSLLRKEYASYHLGFSPDGEQLWWIDRDNARWVFSLRGATVRRIGDGDPLPIEPEPQQADVRDGLLHYRFAPGHPPAELRVPVASPDQAVRELVLPWDDEQALLAPDLRSVCGGSSHAALANV